MWEHNAGVSVTLLTLTLGRFLRDWGGVSLYILSYTNNRKRLSVPCYFLAPCGKRKHSSVHVQRTCTELRRG